LFRGAVASWSVCVDGVAQGQKAGCFRPSILLRVTFAQSIGCFKRRGNKPASRRNWSFIVPPMTTALESSCEPGTWPRHEDNGPSSRKDCDALSASRIRNRSRRTGLPYAERCWFIKHGRSEKAVATPFESHPKNSNDGKSLTTEANVDENKSLAVNRPLFGQFNLRNLKKNRGSGEGPYARIESGRCGKAHKTPDLGCFAMTYGVVRAFQVIQNTLIA
jgi:hypothetical protein